MATRIKTNTLEKQIEFIDQIASNYGVDLRKVAQDAINRREGMRRLGAEIAQAITFSQGDTILVKNMVENIH